MQKLLLAVLLCIVSLKFSFATNYHITTGTRANSMGKASASLIDSWGIFNNQASMAFTDKTTLLTYCENRFGLKEFSSLTAALVVPGSHGAFGANITYFGLELYHEQKIGLAYARKFGENFSMGLQFDLLNLAIPSTGISENAISFEGGLTYKPSSHLIMGFHIFNPIQASFPDNSNKSTIPQITRLGITYIISDNFLIIAEMEHSSETDMTLKTGLEYRILDWLAIRSGYYEKPQTCTFGLGITIESLKIGLAYQFSNSRNRTPGITVLYQF